MTNMNGQILFSTHYHLLQWQKETEITVFDVKQWWQNIQMCAKTILSFKAAYCKRKAFVQCKLFFLQALQLLLSDLIALLVRLD